MRIMTLIRNKLQYNKWKNSLKHRNIKLCNPENIMNYTNIDIGENVYIGPGAYIMAKGGLSIGDNVIIGPKLTVWTENHNFKSEKMIPYDKENVLRPVIIRSNVWIGLGVTLCPGVEIGEGSIIGMGAVVRGKIPSCSIVVGNPGEIVDKRNEDVYYKLIKEQKIFTWNSRV